jgi:hypothetical protein
MILKNGEKCKRMENVHAHVMIVEERIVLVDCV